MHLELVASDDLGIDGMLAADMDIPDITVIDMQADVVDAALPADMGCPESEEGSEERCDGCDNDGDGLVDESGRVVAGMGRQALKAGVLAPMAYRPAQMVRVECQNRYCPRSRAVTAPTRTVTDRLTSPFLRYVESRQVKVWVRAVRVVRRA